MSVSRDNDFKDAWKKQNTRKKVLFSTYSARSASLVHVLTHLKGQEEKSFLRKKSIEDAFLRAFVGRSTDGLVCFSF